MVHRKDCLCLYGADDESKIHFLFLNEDREGLFKELPAKWRIAEIV